jgi:hypothetical protein
VRAVLYHDRERLWNRDLSALSPVSAAAQALDASMRADLGAPDIGTLVVVNADSEQAALQLSEAVGARLDAPDRRRRHRRLRQRRALSAQRGHPGRAAREPAGGGPLRARLRRPPPACRCERMRCSRSCSR